MAEQQVSEALDAMTAAKKQHEKLMWGGDTESAEAVAARRAFIEASKQYAQCVSWDELHASIEVTNETDAKGWPCFRLAGNATGRAAGCQIQKTELRGQCMPSAAPVALSAQWPVGSAFD